MKLVSTLLLFIILGAIATYAYELPTIRISVPQSPFVDRNLWLDGTLALECDTFGFDAVAVRTRGRGNSTWIDGVNKRPLRFTLGEARSLLGSEYEAREWILLADFFDRSLLRNYTALHFAASLGSMSFVPSARHVHLYVNGEYMGVYLLTDERNTEPGRLEHLAFDPNPARSSFIIELDSRAANDGAIQNVDFISVNNRLHDIRFPGSSARTPAHMAYVLNYMYAVCNALRFGTWEEITALIDLPSFVDFYIVQEFMKDPDGAYLSVWMHITGIGDERRLYKGPVWDFDIAAGNHGDNRFMTPHPEGLCIGTWNAWYRYLLRRDEFVYLVASRWAEIRDIQVAAAINRVFQTAERYSADFERNFVRHPFSERYILRHNTATSLLETHSEQVRFLANWLTARAAWLDTIFLTWFNEYTTNGNKMPLEAWINFVEPRLSIHYLGDEIPIVPFRFRGVVLLGFRDILDMFDAEGFIYEQLFILRDDNVIRHIIGTDIFYVNGTRTRAAIPSLYITDQLFLPIRSIAEALGYTVSWETRTLTVTISRP